MGKNLTRSDRKHHRWGVGAGVDEEGPQATFWVREWFPILIAVGVMQGNKLGRLIEIYT